MRSALLLLPLLAACPPTKSDTADTAAFPCEADEALVTGTVYQDGVAVGGGDVAAYESATEARVAGTAEADGTYALCVPAGEWFVYAMLDGCDDGELLTLAAGESYSLDMNVPQSCDTADKPNLYLYPAVPTRTSVRVEKSARQRIFASEPAYERGWSGIAMPDGRFVTKGAAAPFLFYEITLEPRQVAPFQRDEGWCFEADAVAGMAGVLDMYGFNAGEIDDFVEGWRLDLPPAGAYAVYPQTDVDHAAGLTITPALPVDRLWLLVEDVGACVEALPTPSVVPFDRTGAHGVEWGVVLHGFVR
jgi:hypothetical protein